MECMTYALNSRRVETSWSTAWTTEEN